MLERNLFLGGNPRFGPLNLEEPIVNLVRGQKFKLADVGLDSRLSIGLRVAGPALEYDLSVFGLIDGKLEDDRYFVFFNNKQSPEGAIAMRTRSGDEQLFDLDVAKLPARVTRLVFTATVDQGDFSLISPRLSGLS